MSPARRCPPQLCLQGGRWLESSTVEHEGPGGYGAARHHTPQTASPEARRWLGGWVLEGCDAGLAC